MNFKKLILLSMATLPGVSFCASFQSGAAFLTIDPGARPSAMAGAYTAAAGDLDSLYYNPAGLSAMVRAEGTFTHAEWLAGTRYDYAAYAQPTRFGTFGVSLMRLGYGDLEGRSASRQKTGDFGADDSAYSLAYSRSLGSLAGVGVNVKALRRTIGSDEANSYALDLGGVGKMPGQSVWVGASVLNIGPGMRFLDQRDPLPLTFAVGAAAEPASHLKVTMDLKHEPHDQRTTGMIGGEYTPLQPLALRMGYVLPFASTGDSLAGLDNVRGGIGIQINRFRADYALTPFGDLGLTHRFTISFTFGSTVTPTPQAILPALSQARAFPDL